MRQMLLAPLAAALLAFAMAGPAGAQDALDLPDGVEAGAQRMTACFQRGELQAIEAQLDATRVPVAGCAQGMIPPQRTIDVASIYQPGDGSVFDCASVRRGQAGSRALYGFLRDVVAAAESPAPACAAGMIRAWAEADAMSSLAPDSSRVEGRLMEMFMLGGLSSAYLIHPEVRAAAGAEGDQAILAWFGRRAGQVAGDIDRAIADKRPSNTLYWRGFSILPTGLMTADPELVRRSRATFRLAMQNVTRGEPDPADDGFLMAELRRGDKALTYQNFAALPIVGMATLSQAYGCGFLAGPERRDAFVSLLSRSIQGGIEPEIFPQAAVRLGAAKTPQTQTITRTVRQAPDLIYLVGRIDPKLAGRIDAELAQSLGAARPAIAPGKGPDLVNNRLGGSYGRLGDAGDRLAAQPAPAGLRKLCGG